MPVLKAKYPKDSTFGKRIEDNLQKRMVGKYIADEFLADGVTAFITDGSSTLYVGLALYRKAMNRPGFTATIYTNNLALAHEFPLWDSPPNKQIPNVNVSIASGDVISDLMMVGGLDARAYSSCLLYTSPSPRDQRGSRMPSSA